LELLLRAAPREPFAPQPALSRAEASRLEVATTRPRPKSRDFPFREESLLFAKDPFPSAEELRDALAKAEGPQGRGPDSQEALALKSRLGLELWDMAAVEDEASAEEATEPPREASVGLDRLLGPAAPESLRAKERLARRLAGLYGYGRIPPLSQEFSTSAELAAAQKIIREIKKSAPLGAATKALVAYIEKDSAMAISVARKFQNEGQLATITITGEEDQVGRAFHDLALVAAVSGDVNSTMSLRGNALSRRGAFYGDRHPETARSFALMGDLQEDERIALPYWALALEAIAPRGSRYAIMKAELARRIGVTFFMEDDYAQAAKVFREAAGLYGSCRPDWDRGRLDCASSLAMCLFAAGDLADARKEFLALGKALSQTSAPRAPGPAPSPAVSYRALSLAGIGIATVLLGEDGKAQKLLDRAREIRNARPRSKKARSEANALISARDAPGPIRLLARAARLRRRDSVESFASALAGDLLESFGVDVKTFPD
jgi:tetratricopeptide (TPR) repeat protein